MVELPEELAAKLAQALTRTPGVSVSRIAQLYTESVEFTQLADVGTERGRMSHILEQFGEREAASLSMRDVDAYRKARWNQAPATRNRELARLRKMLHWAVDRGHMSRYPLPRLKPEPERNERSTHRTEEDVRAIVKALRDAGRDVVGAIVATAFDGGLRISEATRLRLDQLDVKMGVVSLAASETKAKRPRSAPLSEWALALIANVERPDGCPWVFPSRLGKPYHRRSVLKYYQEGCVLAGIEAAPGENNVFHDTRGGFASKQIQIGTPVPDLMEIGGWRDYRTMKRYLRRPPRSIAADASARLNESRRPARRAPHKKERNVSSLFLTVKG